MRFRVLDAAVPEERRAWLEAWSRWPAREVFAHPDYVALFARPGDRAVAALGEGDGATVLLPLHLRPLADEAWAGADEGRLDATTPYGYGGPFAWGERAGDDDVAAPFWRAYGAFCRRESIATTFARLSLFPEQLAPIPGDVRVNAPNIAVPLAGGIEAVWDGYEGPVRTAIRKSRRLGLAVEVDTEGARLADFHAVYAHTMERRGADAWYRFPLAFFEELTARLRGQVAFVHAIVGGRVVASDLVLASKDHAYMFLSGTYEEAYPMRPNEAVRHASAEWAISRGMSHYVLGGGYRAGDGVFRHKKIFAPHGEVPFKVACLVHDEPAVHALAATRAARARERGEGWAPRPGFFPVYRA